MKFGPRPTLTPAQIEHARELIDRDGRTVKEAAELLAVHRSTLYRALARGEEVTKTEARRRIEPRACRKSWRPSPMTSWRAGPASWCFQRTTTAH
ncbi:MAG: helix-turn-helix domain-containing protein [Desulfuromonas thiophila]|nr:helix-turn-helix domain-containing protein [Desulfuromonas thiophila]